MNVGGATSVPGISKVLLLGGIGVGTMAGLAAGVSAETNTDFSLRTSVGLTGGSALAATIGMTALSGASGLRLAASSTLIGIGIGAAIAGVAGLATSGIATAIG